MYIILILYYTTYIYITTTTLCNIRKLKTRRNPEYVQKKKKKNLRSANKIKLKSLEIIVGN